MQWLRFTPAYKSMPISRSTVKDIKCIEYALASLFDNDNDIVKLYL